MKRLTSTEFQKYMNQRFEVQFDNELIYDIHLIEINEGKMQEKMSYVPFTLFFKADRENKIFPQGTYPVRSETQEEFSLFLIPRQPDENHIYYEVIFN